MASTSSSGFLIARQSGGDVPVCPSHLEVLKNLLAFFALNIGAHALTILEMPGQQLPQDAVMSALMLVSPVFARGAYSHALGKMLREWWKRWYALAKTRLSWRERLRWAMGGDGRGDWHLQVAIDAGAVAIPVEPAYRANMANWKTLDMKSWLRRRDALWSNGAWVGEDPPELRYVPVGTETASTINVKPSSSWLNAIIAIVQMSYGIIELYASDRPEVRQRGLSSPYIVIIPYIVMSLANLIINLGVTTYPYVTVLCPIGSPRSPDEKSEKNAFQFSSELSTQVRDSGISDDAKLSFELWLKQKYDLTLPKSTAAGEYSLEWVTTTLPITLFICYGVITLVLLGVTRMKVDSPLLAAGMLCWIYSGVIQYIVLFSLGLLDHVMGGFFTSRLGKNVVVDILAFVLVLVAALGPLVPGVYCTVIQLWKYYSLCGYTSD